MRLYNIEANFILDSSLDDNVLEIFLKKYTSYISRGCGATVFTVFIHNKNVTHVLYLLKIIFPKTMILYNIKAHFNLGRSSDDSVLENFTMKYTRNI